MKLAIGLVAASEGLHPSLSLCEKCLQEPLEAEYYGAPGSPVPRFSNYSTEEFRRAALLGKVFVVSDAMRSAEFAGWSCEKMATEFPEAKMRREYDWEKNGKDHNLQKLGDQKWITTTEQGEEAADRLKQDQSTPPFAPFYWGVREFKGDNSLGPKETIMKFKDNLVKSVPYFLDPKNAQSMFANTEMWMGAQKTGARAHMDSHCISTLGYVLKGKRRWRIGPIPRVPPGAGKVTKNVVFDDGVAYALKWKPFYEFEVEEGEALFFPPGWIHETYNTDPGCTNALTTQFAMPKPIHYYRNYYNRMRRVGDLSSCWEEVAGWANFGNRLPKAYARYDEAVTQAEKQFTKLDADKDGQLTLEEFKKGVPAGRKGITPPTYEGSFLWYDLDLDDKVTKEELVDTFARWSETEFHIGQEKEKNPERFKPDMTYDAEPSKKKGGKKKGKGKKGSEL
mmetsp:Transcript_30447/g.78674  ORF Transcript_30447/g.78674 Transcript_30447/m.78674 type:complete len:451 (-) Transcript_30447:111-1463(-)